MSRLHGSTPTDVPVSDTHGIHVVLGYLCQQMNSTNNVKLPSNMCSTSNELLNSVREKNGQ